MFLARPLLAAALPRARAHRLSALFALLALSAALLAASASDSDDPEAEPEAVVHPSDGALQLMPGVPTVARHALTKPPYAGAVTQELNYAWRHMLPTAPPLKLSPLLVPFMVMNVVTRGMNLFASTHAPLPALAPVNAPWPPVSRVASVRLPGCMMFRPTVQVMALVTLGLMVRR